MTKLNLPFVTSLWTISLWRINYHWLLFIFNSGDWCWVTFCSRHTYTLYCLMLMYLYYVPFACIIYCTKKKGHSLNSYYPWADILHSLSSITNTYPPHSICVWNITLEHILVGFHLLEFISWNRTGYTLHYSLKCVFSKNPQRLINFCFE